MQNLTSLAAGLDAGTITSRALVEQCLAAIADPAGEGTRAFITVYAETARAQADATDTLRRVGRSPGPYAGIPVSLKDLFDVAGEVTRAGSTVLNDAAPATAHAPVVARLLAAGFIPIGRTNMTEFALSGLGINPHYPTPSSPWDRASRRVPGGSSSGAAVSVADGMAFVGLGTDTAGSCRVPAALCGVVGYKPTARRVPLAGVLPLSFSLDSVGPLARNVADCAIVDAVLAGEAPHAPFSRPLSGVRLALPARIVMDGLDPEVAAAFDQALATLRAAGAIIEQVDFPAMSRISAGTIRASISVCEGFAWHRTLLARSAAGYDQRVRTRLEGGNTASIADYLDALAIRRSIGAEMDAATAPYDAVVMPSVPLLPPPIAVLEADEAEYWRVNALMLRNTAFANFLDRCSITLPCHAPGAPPAGLMLMGETMGDHRLFALAAGIEQAMARNLAGVTDMTMRAALIAATLLYPCTVMAQPAAVVPAFGTISTSATAQRRLPNTVSDVAVSIEVHARDVPTATSMLAQKSKLLLDYLRGAKVERLRSEQVSVDPETEEVRGKPDRITGFTGHMVVSFRTTPQAAPVLLAGSLDHGATGLQNAGSAPAESDVIAARQDLAAEAAKTALTQAKAISDAVGERFAGVSQIEVAPEESDRPSPMMAPAMMKAARTSEPIATEAGEAEITVKVSVTIRIER